MPWTHTQMAARAAQELHDGEYVNVGIGLPTLIPEVLPPERQVILHSENGILGVAAIAEGGGVDPDLVDAGKAPVAVAPGASFFDSSLSFAMIRGGYLDATVLGALQVSAAGDLANWVAPGTMIRGIGGAMDMVQGARRVIVLMDHVAKDGSPKILSECTFPLTGRRVVDRIITNLGVLDVTPAGLTLVELAPGVGIAQLRAATEPPVAWSSGRVE
jgi:3-oxoacid CoA-transferase subunit B